MDHRTERHPGTAPVPPVLRVTLVSGIDTAERSRVCRLLSGTSSDAAPGTEIEEETEDSGEFALVLADRLLAAAHAGETGRTVVALDPDADVMEVGFVLETAFEDRRNEGPPAELHDLVSVVSVRDVHRWMLSTAPAPAVDHVTAELIASQLEFATVIVLTDADAALPEHLRSTLGLVQRLNPDAAVVTGNLSGMRTSRRPGGRWCARRIGRRMGWMLELAAPNASLAWANDVGALVFRDPRPFHPERLFDAVVHQLVPQRVGRIARSRGLVQLATRADHHGSWRSAGDTVSFDPTGLSSWDSDAPAGHEMVFFGEHLDRERIITTLHGCLLTDDELIAGPGAWARFADPFPAWPVHHHP